MKTYVIRPIPLVLGAATLDSRLFRCGARWPIPHCISVFYIQGASRQILVDTGATAEDFAKIGSQGYRDTQTLPEELAKLRLKPEDIDLVIQTHLHFDHRSYALIFKKAKSLVQMAELEYHRRPPPYEPRPCPGEVLDAVDWQVLDGDYQVEEGIKISTHSSDELYNPPSGMVWTGPVATAAIHTDPELAYRSAMRVKEMADIVVPLHEARWVWTEAIP